MKMNQRILIIGGGGREHALAWKLEQSRRIAKIFVAPGNGGTAEIAENVKIRATDIEGLLAFALEKRIDLTIVGQDDPLAMGIVDLFQKNGLRIFGPSQTAAEIESSKVFSKDLMNLLHIPTAPFSILSNPEDASSIARRHFASSTEPLVLKASGLALGKGAYVCGNLEEAKVAIDDIMLTRIYGAAGDQMIIEKFIAGQEVSIHAFCDGISFKLFPSAQDHKPIFESDKGPNTGGMGTIAPVPWFTQSKEVSELILEPILVGLKEEDRPFKGLLFPGLKISEDGPVVLEFNARFGDPETQVYMRLLKTDLLDIFETCVDGRLHEIDIEWYPGFAACIVLASSGYPSPDYKKHIPVTGIKDAELLPGVVVFHAGTARRIDGHLVTSGGRVLGVTGIGATLEEALKSAYEGVDRIHFEGMQFRKDIGAKSLGVLP